MAAYRTGSSARCCPRGPRSSTAHVHLGHDIDGIVQLHGRAGGPPRRVRLLALLHVLHGRRTNYVVPAFRMPNNQDARRRGALGRQMVPFRPPRPEDGPRSREDVRCLDRGAKGMPALHPRAQRFALNDERLAPMFELTTDQKVTDPDSHGGRRLAADRRQPREPRRPVPQYHMIITHARIADLARTGADSRRPRGSLLRHVGLEPDGPTRLLPPFSARAVRLRV